MDWKKESMSLLRSPAGGVKQHDDVLPMAQIVSYTLSAQQRHRNRQMSMPLFVHQGSKEDQGEPMSQCFVNSLCQLLGSLTNWPSSESHQKRQTLFFRERRRRICFARGCCSYSLLTVWVVLSNEGKDNDVCCSTSFYRRPGSISESKMVIYWSKVILSHPESRVMNYVINQERLSLEVHIVYFSHTHSNWKQIVDPKGCFSLYLTSTVWHQGWALSAGLG